MAPLFLWALRDLKRRPLESVLLTIALLSTFALTATPLLLSRAATSTWDSILKEAPSLVVRAFNTMGWTPLPADESVAIVESVTGVTAARARVWGQVAGPSGLLTVIGVDTDRPPPWVSVSPGRDEAVVGMDVDMKGPDTELTLTGEVTATLRVIGRFTAVADLAVNNAVLIHIDKAREILGISAGYATDLAVDVFNPAEEEAILPDLSAAFPRPVRIITRTETAGIHAAGFARRAGMTVVTLVPAFLALCLLVIVTIRERLARRFEIALLKALGWTTANIVSLQVLRAAAVSTFAAVGGMIAAFILVYHHSPHWSEIFYPEWRVLPARLSFKPFDLALPWLEATGLVLLPYMAATISAALRCAVSLPGNMLERTTS